MRTSQCPPHSTWLATSSLDYGDAVVTLRFVLTILALAVFAVFQLIGLRNNAQIQSDTKSCTKTKRLVATKGPCQRNHSNPRHPKYTQRCCYYRHRSHHRRSSSSRKRPQFSPCIYRSWTWKCSPSTCMLCKMHNSYRIHSNRLHLHDRHVWDKIKLSDVKYK